MGKKSAPWVLSKISFKRGCWQALLNDSFIRLCILTQVCSLASLCHCHGFTIFSAVSYCFAFGLQHFMTIYKFIRIYRFINSSIKYCNANFELRNSRFRNEILKCHSRRIWESIPNVKVEVIDKILRLHLLQVSWPRDLGSVPDRGSQLRLTSCNGSQYTSTSTDWYPHGPVDQSLSTVPSQLYSEWQYLWNWFLLFFHLLSNPRTVVWTIV